MAIYTKKGDVGQTRVFSSRDLIPKNSTRIAAIGAIDEFNSFLGIIISEDFLSKDLVQIQKNLFVIGAILAGAPLRFSKSKTSKLERQIDRIEGSLPVLKNFILPGGAPSASKLFFARGLARRAERAVVALNAKEKLKPEILVYINRLSDYLFMLAREVNFKMGNKEQVWKVKGK